MKTIEDWRRSHVAASCLAIVQLAEDGSSCAAAALGALVNVPPRSGDSADEARRYLDEVARSLEAGARLARSAAGLLPGARAAAAPPALSTRIGRPRHECAAHGGHLVGSPACELAQERERRAAEGRS